MKMVTENQQKFEREKRKMEQNHQAQVFDKSGIAKL